MNFENDFSKIQFRIKRISLSTRKLEEMIQDIENNLSYIKNCNELEKSSTSYQSNKELLNVTCDRMSTMESTLEKEKERGYSSSNLNNLSEKKKFKKKNPVFRQIVSDSRNFFMTKQEKIRNFSEFSKKALNYESRISNLQTEIKEKYEDDLINKRTKMLLHAETVNKNRIRRIQKKDGISYNSASGKYII